VTLPRFKKMRERQKLFLVFTFIAFALILCKGVFFFKFGVEVGVEESIVNEPLV
jgi:hypothetical protein